MPDEALQPGSTAAGELRWELRNLVTNRRISVPIPAAQAPLAGMLLLLRLVVMGVLLFGAGFLYLSERSDPCRLDRFRLGHFLLAATYSLFFAVFAVLEVHGVLGTVASMGLAALFSLPLLVLHVSRILGFRFAVTRVVPLALLTLGLVINGVYGGAARDYVFLGAVILLVGFVTLDYEGWTAIRERHRRARSAEFVSHSKDLANELAALSALLADLESVDAAAAALTAAGSDPDPASRRLAGLREPLGPLREELDLLVKRHRNLTETPGWEPHEEVRRLAGAVAGLSDRAAALRSRLQREIEACREAAGAADPEDGFVHCAACGAAVPAAPYYCCRCGRPSPQVHQCTACGERLVVPTHLLAAEASLGLFCIRCGSPAGRKPQAGVRADSAAHPFGLT